MTFYSPSVVASEAIIIQRDVVNSSYSNVKICQRRHRNYTTRRRRKLIIDNTAFYLTFNISTNSSLSTDDELLRPEIILERLKPGILSFYHTVARILGVAVDIESFYYVTKQISTNECVWL